MRALAALSLLHLLAALSINTPLYLHAWWCALLARVVVLIDRRALPGVQISDLILLYLSSGPTHGTWEDAWLLARRHTATRARMRGQLLLQGAEMPGLMLVGAGRMAWETAVEEGREGEMAGAAVCAMVAHRWQRVI